MIQPFSNAELLPAHLKPQPDEILSSWLVRLSRANGVKLHTLCSQLFPRKSIWNRDIDKCARKKLLETLANRTGTSLQRATETTLATYAGWLYEKHNPLGNTLWLMPVGVYHRVRKQFGMQFCAECLAEDKEPFFRRSWRIAFNTVCAKHCRLLHDRCDHCGQPVNFHRGELGQKSRIVPNPISVCQYCLRDLTKCRATEVDQADIQCRSILVASLKRGWVYLSAHGPVYSHLYFAGLHQTMRLLATGRHAANLRAAICMKAGIQDVQPFFPTGNRDIERLNVLERNRLVRMAVWLLSAWPNRFIQILSENRIWSSTVLRDFEHAPFWYWQIVHDHLYRSSHVSSNMEIESAIIHLKRKGAVISKKTVSETLGQRDVFRKRKGYSFNG